MRFAGRLVLGTILVLLFAITVMLWVSQRGLRRDLEQETARALAAEAHLVARVLPADSLAWDRAARAYAEATGHRITIVDPGGRVRAETAVPRGDLAGLANHADRPEIRAALDSGQGTALRRSATIDQPLLYVAVRGGPGVVRVAASLEQVDAAVARAQASVAWAGVLALLVGSVLALVAARSVARPLTALGGAARSIAAGTVPRFPRSGIPEVDDLVQALRQMHRQLADRFQELRQAQSDASALVDSMVEGVLASDVRGRIVTANAAARDVLGYEPDEPLPNLRQVFRAKGARDVVDAILAGGAVTGREVELDGRTFLLSGRPLDAGGAVLVLHDLTDLRRLEAVRRDFVANVSHELKTPLTSISGYAETLLADPVEPSVQRTFLETILSNARRMQRLVDDLLDLSRIESGRWQANPEPVDVEAAALEAWQSLGARRAGREVAFEVSSGDPGLSAHADPDALRQILVNLLDNALRHTPDGGEIRVTAQPERGGTLIEVRDTGAGIAAEHLPRIFERFYRVDPSRSRDEGGTGLGLAIVKHLMEAHGGRVAAESARRQGTSLRLWFPGADAARS